MDNESKHDITDISKSQIKRDMHALQVLGEKLADLRSEQLAQFDLPETLVTALTQAKTITKHGAKKRQLQYIGRLMRSVDADIVQQQYDMLTRQSGQSINQLHKIEQWREKLINEGDAVLTEFLTQYPQVDRQQLRTLLRSAIQERDKNKPPKAIK
jgi:ribosome-associated protein